MQPSNRNNFFQWDINAQLLITTSDINAVDPDSRIGTINGIRFQQSGFPVSLDVEEFTGSRETGLTVTVPDVLLQRPKSIGVFLRYGDEDDYLTLAYLGEIEITPCVKPADYVYSPEDIREWESLNTRLTALEQTVTLNYASLNSSIASNYTTLNSAIAAINAVLAAGVKNPYPLQFTGASGVTYDGHSPQSVHIPEGSNISIVNIGDNQSSKNSSEIRSLLNAGDLVFVRKLDDGSYYTFGRIMTATNSVIFSRLSETSETVMRLYTVEIFSDSSVESRTIDLQRKLTAGDNITISSNGVISSSGGGGGGSSNVLIVDVSSIESEDVWELNYSGSAIMSALMNGKAVFIILADHNNLDNVEVYSFSHIVEEYDIYFKNGNRAEPKLIRIYNDDTYLARKFNGYYWAEDVAYTGNETVRTALDSLNENKVSVAQGSSHAGEFLVVGSDGNVKTIALEVWQGGEY